MKIINKKHTADVVMNTKTETNNRASFLENVKELAKVKRKSYFILFQKLQEAGCATDKASGNFVAVLLNKSIKKNKLYNK